MLDSLGIGGFGVSYNNLSKEVLAREKKYGFKIIWVHVSRLLVPHPDQRLMETHHVH